MTCNGLELDTIDEWVYATLLANTTLVGMLGDKADAPEGPGLFADTIRDNTTYPYVLWKMMSEADSLTSYGDTILVVADYNIQVVDRAETYDAIKPINKLVYTDLHQQSGTATDGVVRKCIRLRQVKYPSINETIQYRHLGGIYRFWVEGP